MRRLASLVPLLVLLAAPAVAPAAEINAGQGCDCFSPATVTMDMGEPLSFRNSDLLKEHDLLAKDRGPDGKPLFSAPQIGPGGSAPVDGSQFLTTGTYGFVCTLHTGMEGTLNVTSSGTPTPRPPGGGTPSSDATAPSVALRLAGSKASKLRRSRRVRAVVTVDEESKVALSAFVGSRKIGSVKGELFKGAPTDLVVRVSRANARRLRKGARLTLRAAASDPAGNTGEGSLTRRLR